MSAGKITSSVINPSGFNWVDMPSIVGDAGNPQIIDCSTPIEFVAALEAPYDNKTLVCTQDAYYVTPARLGEAGPNIAIEVYGNCTIIGGVGVLYTGSTPTDTVTFTKALAASGAVILDTTNGPLFSSSLVLDGVEYWARRPFFSMLDVGGTYTAINGGKVKFETIISAVIPLAGTQQSWWYDPEQTTDISGLVPYTGATADVDIGTHKITTAKANFSGANASPAKGDVWYDDTTNTLCVKSDISGQTLNVGQESILRVVNATGSTITNGSCVYVNGAVIPGLPTIALADNTVEASIDKIIGVVTADILDATEGYVCTNGYVRDINTNAWTIGTVLYVGTSGGFTSTKPTGTALVQQIGIVMHKGVADGIIAVSLVGPSHLADLHDVNDGTPTNNYFLKGDSTHWGRFDLFGTVNTWNAGQQINGFIGVTSIGPTAPAAYLQSDGNDVCPAAYVQNTNDGSSAGSSIDYSLSYSGSSYKVGRVQVKKTTGSQTEFSVHLSTTSVASRDEALAIDGLTEMRIPQAAVKLSGIGSVAIDLTQMLFLGAANSVKYADLSTVLGGYLPLTGGTITGNLTIGDAPSDTLTVNATPTFATLAGTGTRLTTTTSAGLLQGIATSIDGNYTFTGTIALAGYANTIRTRSSTTIVTPNTSNSLIISPPGNSYTGVLYIRLPIPYGSMVKVSLSLYDYSISGSLPAKCATIEVSGYYYRAGDNWVGGKATIISHDSWKADAQVRLGIDSGGYPAIAIGAPTGSAWSYTRGFVEKVILGLSSATDDCVCSWDTDDTTAGFAVDQACSIRYAMAGAGVLGTSAADTLTVNATPTFATAITVLSSGGSSCATYDRASNALGDFGRTTYTGLNASSVLVSYARTSATIISNSDTSRNGGLLFEVASNGTSFVDAMLLSGSATGTNCTIYGLAGTGTRLTTSSSTGLQGTRLANSYIIQTLTANAAIALDTELVRMTGTGFTGTLTTSLGDGRLVSFRNSGTGNLTIACNGAETIDGVATLVIPVGGIAKICSVASGVWETVL